jgi:hypothetical protein
MARLDHAVRKHQGVDKTGASHIDVETRAGDTNALLDDTAQSWGDVLVCHIRDQEEVNLVGTQARGVDGFSGSINSQVI